MAKVRDATKMMKNDGKGWKTQQGVGALRKQKKKKSEEETQEKTKQKQKSSEERAIYIS
jgi:hypothetical protein